MKELVIFGGCVYASVWLWEECMLILLQCFKIGDELVVNYSVTQAFG